MTIAAMSGHFNMIHPDVQIRQAGLQVIPHPFADHHCYRAEDLEFAADEALLMTSKDAVKVADRLPAWVVEVEVTPLAGSWQRLWQLLPEVAPA